MGILLTLTSVLVLITVILVGRKIRSDIYKSTKYINPIKVRFNGFNHGDWYIDDEGNLVVTVSNEGELVINYYQD